MTERKGKADLIDLKELLGRDQDFVRAALEALLQAALEVEMTEAIGAEKGERTETRLAYRSGYYGRSLIHAGGNTGAAGAAGPARAVLDRVVRALSALGEILGECSG